MTGLMIHHFYPLEQIEVLAKDFSDAKEDSISEFIEFYDQIVVKLPENNFNKRGHNTPSWRRKVKCSSRDISKYLRNSWKPSVPKNDAEKIRSDIIGNLNKLNEKKFTIITKEFIDCLEKAYYIDTYNILIEELFKKIDCDRKYLKIYAKLVYELCVNKKWQKNMFSITNDEKKKDFFWTINSLSDQEEGASPDDKSYYGPFDSKEDALKDALGAHGFEQRIIRSMEDRFRDRETYYFASINESRDNFDMYNFSKNKYLNFLEILFYMFNMQFLHEGVILNTLLVLFNSYCDTSYDESLEGFIHLYKLYKKNGSYSISKKNHSFFNEKIKDLNERVKLPSRLKFFLGFLFDINIDTLIEQNQKEVPKIVPETKVLDEDESSIMENIQCLIEEYPTHQCYDGCKDTLSEIPDTYNDRLLENCLQKVITSNSSDVNMWIDLVKSMLENREKFKDVMSTSSAQLIENYSDIKIDFPIAASNLKLYLDFLQNNHSEFFEVIKSKSKDFDEELLEDLVADFSEEFKFLQVQES